MSALVKDKEAAAAAPGREDDFEDWTSWEPWSVEEDQTFIQARKEGKTDSEIAAMLPGRTKGAVRERWYYAKLGKTGSAALRAYAAECRKA